MRTPEFEAYVHPARLYPQIWRILLGLLLIVFIYLGFVGLVFWAGFAYATPFKFLSWALEVASTETPMAVLVLLLTFGGMALGPIIAAPACHGRSPATLFGPLGDTMRGFVTACVVAALFLGVFLGISFFAYPPTTNLVLENWLRYLPLALPLLLLQVSAEELLFRGYLQQQLAARFKARFIWMMLPSLAFGALHYNAQLGANTWLIVGATTAFGLIAADLTERTGSLGAAIGLHFVNNLFALLLVSTKESITGLALFLSPLDMQDTPSLALALGLDVLALLILWRILRFALER